MSEARDLISELHGEDPDGPYMEGFDAAIWFNRPGPDFETRPVPPCPYIEGGVDAEKWWQGFDEAVGK